MGVQGLALFGFIGLSSDANCVASAALYGLGLGGVSPLQAALLARRFGSTHFAPAMGLLSPLMTPFQITGPPVTGYIFDRLGSDDLALWCFVASLEVAAVALSFVRLPAPTSERPRREPEPARAH